MDFKKLREEYQSKYNMFYLCEYGGDWDTGSVIIGLN